MIRSAFTSPGVRAILFLASFFLLSALATNAWAASALMMQNEDDEDVTWNLTADSVSALSDSEVLEARGNVTLRRGDDVLRADFARYYMATKWVFLQGNVQVNMGTDELKAEEAEFDLRSRVGWLKHGQVFMEGPHVYFGGDRIDKHYGDVYTFRNAKVTACDGDVPAWSLTAQEAVIELDGYAQLWNTTFQVMDKSLAVAPWMLIPAKRDRQSGLLTPEFGRSSRKGGYFNQPLFWAIDESRDLTLYTNIMENYGLMEGLEYRSSTSARDRTWFRADYLSDNNKVHKDSDDRINPRDGLIRTNSDRFWLRGMYEGGLPGDPKWRLRADVDWVSDQNYLHEFKNGLSGFRYSRDALFDFFNRDIRERDQNRQSGIMLFRDWERVSFALSSTYEQNLAVGNGNRPHSSDTTVQQLPAASLFLHKGRILPEIPVEISGSAEAGYMFRRNGTRGARYDIAPKATLPITGRYGSLITSGTVRQTYYETEHPSKENNFGPRQKGDARTIPEFETHASTEVMRDFTLAGQALAGSTENIGKSRWSAMRHTVQPRVSYRNIPKVDQDDNPEYVGEDRILPVNELTYSVTNILTRKRERVTATPAKDGKTQTPQVETDYLEVVRLKLEQSYDLREADRDTDRREYRRQPYSDVRSELIFRLDEYVSFVNRLYYSPYRNEMTREDYGVNVAYAPYGSLYMGLDRRRKLDEYTRRRNRNIDSLRFDGTLNIYGPLAVRTSYRYDYHRDEEVERTVDLIYNHQCFQLVARASKDTGEENYQLFVVLTGLGN